MAKQKPAAAAPVARDEGRSPDPAAKPTTLSVERVIQNVLGVGAAVAAKLAKSLDAADRQQVIDRYSRPRAHDEIRQLVLTKQPQPQKKPNADEPGHDGNGA